MGDGKEDLQNLAISDLVRVEGDPHRFRVAGVALAGHVVMRGRRRAAVVAGNRADDAVDMLEHALDAPETSAGDHGDLGTGRGAVSSTAGGGTLRASSAVDRVAAKPIAVSAAPTINATAPERLVNGENMAGLLFRRSGDASGSRAGGETRKGSVGDRQHAGARTGMKDCIASWSA